MQNPQQIEAKAESRHKVILIIWFALLMSISIFFAMTMFIPGSPNPNPLLSLALIAAAFMVVAASVLIKLRVLQRALDKRDAAMLQSGYIVSFALCESAALCGLLDHLVTGSSYYYFSFALAVLGMLFHFPKKDDVRGATA